MRLSVPSNTSNTALHHFLGVVQHGPDATSAQLEMELKLMGHIGIVEGGETVRTGRSNNE